MPRSSSIDELIYHLSHDLSAPIRQVHSFANLLKNSIESSGDDEQATYLDFIIRQSGLAQQMLKALLELSRVPVEIDRQDTLDLNTFADALAEHHRELNILHDLPSSLKIRCNAEYLYTMVGALAQNVKDHCEDKDWSITAKLTDDEKFIRLQFTDRGPGISEEQWQQYLMPFGCGRGHPDADNLGMGLTMVNKIAQGHGSPLTYISSPNGLCCQIELERQIEIH